jgi:hypothetical protein
LQRIRAISEKLIVAHLLRTCHIFYATRKNPTIFHIQSQINPVSTPTLCLKIILKWSFHLRPGLASDVFFVVDDMYSNNERLENGDVILRHPIIL